MEKLASFNKKGHEFTVLTEGRKCFIQMDGGKVEKTNPYHMPRQPKGRKWVYSVRGDIAKQLGRFDDDVLIAHESAKDAIEKTKLKGDELYEHIADQMEISKNAVIAIAKEVGDDYREIVDELNETIQGI